MIRHVLLRTCFFDLILGYLPYVMNRTSIICFGILLLLLVRGVSVSVGQTINATSNTGWTAWLSGAGNMLDPENDQQTGQGQDDFAGDATTAALQSQAGEASFDAGVDYLFLRARFNDYSADNKWGNGGNWGTGMDIDGDGDLDLIMMFSEGSGNVKNRTHTIQFGAPGSGANDGPSTTTWTFPTQTAISLTVGQTYNVQNASTSDSVQIDGDDDAWLTFGLSFSQLETAIQTYAVGDVGDENEFANYSLTYESRIAFVAFTSTQDNALNQDLGGVDGGTSSGLSWAELGAITPPMGPGGFVPEPGTYVQIGFFLLIGIAAMYRRRTVCKNKTDEN